MQLFRISAVIVRYLLEVPRDFFRIFDITFYPTMDIILWGFMSLWIQSGSGSANYIGQLVLVSLVMWMIVENANREIAFNLTEELYAHNLVNMLVTPLQLKEWLSAVILLSIVRATFVFIFCSCIIWLLRGINILSLGIVLSAMYCLLLMSGIALGLAISSLMIRWGRRISTFIWSIPYLVLSFSAVFYPLHLLPPWAQCVGRAMPISYVFEVLRHTVTTGVISWNLLLVSLILNVMYLGFSLLFFVFMFNRSRKSGIAQLEYY